MRVRQVLQLILTAAFGAVHCLFGLAGDKVVHGPLSMQLVFPANGVPSDHSGNYWVGWSISRHENWHTYWEHPGDVGVAPSVTWLSSSGCTIGEIIFSPPVRVSMSGISAYGHRGETLFLFPLTIPRNLKEKSISLRGNFSWMACSQTCLPASTELSIEIPIVENYSEDPKWTGLFEQFWLSQPQQALPDWSFQVESLGKFYKFHFPEVWPHASREVDFFCEDRLILSDQVPLVREEDGRPVWLLKKSPWAPDSPKEMKGVLLVNESGVGKNYYRISIPVVSP